MKAVKKVGTLVCAACLCATMLMAEDAAPEAPQGRRPRGMQGQGPGQGQNMRNKGARGMRQFLDLPGMKEEMEAHRNKLREIHKSLGENIREAMKQAGGQGGEIDKAAFEKKMEEVTKAAAEAMITENIRHERAKADLMEKNKDASVEKMAKMMLERMKERQEKMMERRKQRGGGGQGRGPQNNGAADDNAAEGAIF